MREGVGEVVDREWEKMTEGGREGVDRGREKKWLIESGKGWQRGWVGEGVDRGWERVHVRER